MTWCTAPARGRRLFAGAVLFLTAASAGCEFPTEAPIFESRFVLPAENTTLSVGELLPSSLTDNGAAFGLTLAPASISRTLGQLCPACVPFNGQSVPYPGFTGSIVDTVALPAEVSRVGIAGGTIQVSMTNTFGFDPLMPPGAAAGGSIRIQALNGAQTVGDTTITGAFANGVTRAVALRLLPVNVTGPIEIRLTIVSPAGGTAPAQFVTINTSGALNVTSAPTGVTVSAADIAVNDENVTVANVALELSGVDETLRKRTVSGALVLEVANPFTVSGNFTMTITGGTTGPIVKTFTLPAGGPGTPPSIRRVEFTGAELQQILGLDVVMNITGTVSGTTPFVTVAPGQVVTFETMLDLVVRTAGDVEADQ
jgi:hypothetical protein